MPTVFHVSTVWVAFLAALVLAVLNVLVKPFLFLLSLPINILTIGLFTLIINGLMLELTSLIIGNQFQFSSFWVAIFVAILMSLISTIISEYFSKD